MPGWDKTNVDFMVELPNEDMPWGFFLNPDWRPFTMWVILPRLLGTPNGRVAKVGTAFRSGRYNLR